MAKDLEQDESQEEQVEEVSDKEQLIPTSEETKKPTLGTRTEEEFRKAQSSRDAQINKAKAETERYKSQADAAMAEAERYKSQATDLEASHQKIQQRLYEIEEREAAGDPDTLGLIKQRRDLEAKAENLARREIEADRKVKYAWALEMKASATRVAGEYGIPIQELESCQSEGEMELKGLKFERQKAKETAETAKEPEGKPPKFDSGVSSGSPPTSFQKAEQRYIDGEITYEEYMAARKEKGIKS